MATYIGAGTAASGFSGALAPTIHASTAAGDTMLLAVHINNALAGPPTVTGWTNVLYRDNGDEISLAVYRRTYTGSSDAPSVPQQGSGAIAQVATWRGIDTSDPVDVVSADGTFGEDANILVEAVTPTAAKGVVVVLGSRLDDWTSVATLSGDGLTWAEIGEPDHSATVEMGMVWDYALFTSTPTLTDKTFTVTGGGSAITAGVMVVLQDPALSGTVAATLQKATASLSGLVAVAPTGTASVSLQRAVAALSGLQATDATGTAAATLRPATASATGYHSTFYGTIAVTVRAATAALSGLHNLSLDIPVGAAFRAVVDRIAGSLRPVKGDVHLVRDLDRDPLNGGMLMYTQQASQLNRPSIRPPKIRGSIRARVS